VQPDDRRGLPFLEMTSNRFAYISTKWFPGVGLRDNGVAEGTGDPAAIGFIFGNVKDDFAHAFKLTQVRVAGKREYRR